MRRAALIAVLLAAGLAGCGGDDGSTNSAATATPTGATVSQQSAPTPPATTETGGATASTVQPKHSKGGPKSAHLPSKGAPDSAITTKTQK
jgi:hypothetical protein